MVERSYEEVEMVVKWKKFLARYTFSLAMQTR
jgi:hypothetical protein